MVSQKFTVMLAVVVVFAFVQTATGSPAIGKKYGNVRTPFLYTLFFGLYLLAISLCVRTCCNLNTICPWTMCTSRTPAPDMMGGFDFLGVCIRNCAQCKKMYGAYFEGQLCADACVKYKGKIIPDCEDIGSIAPFLNKFE